MNYLAYLIKGTAKIVSENKTLYLNESDVFYIPKNLPYQSYWYGDSDIEFLSFGFHDLQLGENVNFELQKIFCNAGLVEKIKNIPTPGRNPDCDTLSCFYAAVHKILPLLEYTAKDREEFIVKKVMDTIQKFPFHILPDIAKLCDISESYMYMLFKKLLHTTPNSYRQQILCEMGIRLLQTTDKSVEDICSMLNFSSSSYFRKVLKKHTGKTPRDIRKNRIFI
jgi:AraC-like DNA-binding protein